MRRTVKIFVILIVALTFISCNVTYTTSEIRNNINEKLNKEPKQFGSENLGIKVNSVRVVTVDEKTQRMTLSFDCTVTNAMKDFVCGEFIISAKPILRNDTLFMSEVRADNIKCGIGLTILTDLVIRRFFKEVDIFALSGIKKALAKDIYIKQEAVVVKVGVI